MDSNRIPGFGTPRIAIPASKEDQWRRDVINRAREIAVEEEARKLLDAFRDKKPDYEIGDDPTWHMRVIRAKDGPADKS